MDSNLIAAVIVVALAVLALRYSLFVCWLIVAIISVPYFIFAAPFILMERIYEYLTSNGHKYS